ncbi:MAG: hypothetical protein E6Q88_01980 [Lysobacteraceae bacterium]|nr:MAG: hypothetical protein E6Q88_01980 [Xanthomonadaceae bacterium]
METRYFADESHGVYGHENQLKYYNRVLAFLRRHLGDGAAGVEAVRGGADAGR